LPSDPLVLAFDTSAAHCAAALLSGERVLVQRHEEMGRGQAERLMPLLEEVLREGGIGWSELSAIGVGIGPGNFTGIRISVSAARGLSMGLGIPAVGVSLFETTANLGKSAQTAVPAPRDHVYYWDADTMAAPVLTALTDDTPVSLSTDHSVLDHVLCIARTAAARLTSRETLRPPAPLYIKPADAAPARDLPPVILDDA
jgi:tRNA threonylcarbamoyl adenosine modification protein YeaZ